MKIARFGQVGSERPAVMVSQTQAVYVDHLIKTLASDDMQGRRTFTPGIEKAATFKLPI